MKTALRLALAGLVILVIAGCSGSVSVSGGAKKQIKTWPVAEPLEGPIPVGRWRCYRAQDFEAMRQSNSAALDDSCNVVRFKLVYEFRADGTGWALTIHHPDNTVPDGFTIPGSSHVYSRADELRWYVDSGGRRMVIQTTINRTAMVGVVNDNTFLYDPNSFVRVFMRIGSVEYMHMEQFRQCIRDNKGRALFDVVDCGEPPDTGRE